MLTQQIEEDEEEEEENKYVILIRMEVVERYKEGFMKHQNLNQGEMK